jgi:hypothetical protein
MVSVREGEWTVGRIFSAVCSSLSSPSTTRVLAVTLPAEEKTTPTSIPPFTRSCIVKGSPAPSGLQLGLNSVDVLQDGLAERPFLALRWTAEPDRLAFGVRCQVAQ